MTNLSDVNHCDTTESESIMDQTRNSPARTAVVRGLAVVGLLAGMMLSCPPAGAHAGGKQQLFVSAFRLDPAADGWIARVDLIDYDSARTASGFSVSLTATSASGEQLGPVELIDRDAAGAYSATITPHPGSWTFVVNADEIPGAAEAIPVRKSFSLTLSPGQAAVGVQRAGREATSGHSGSNAVSLLALGSAVTGGLAVIAALVVAMLRRRPGRLSRVSWE